MLMEVIFSAGNINDFLLYIGYLLSFSSRYRLCDTASTIVLMIESMHQVYGCLQQSSFSVAVSLKYFCNKIL